MHPSNAYVVDASQLNGYGGLQSSWGSWGGTDYAQAKDTKGNVYYVFNDGKIQFRVRPDGTTPSSPWIWYAGGGAVHGTTYEKLLAHLRSVNAF